MSPNEEVELGACGLAARRFAGHPGRAAGDGPAVVARDLQVPVTELVKRLPPPAVRAVEGQRADSLRVPTLHGVVDGHRQVRPEIDLRLAGETVCVGEGWVHGVSGVSGADRIWRSPKRHARASPRPGRCREPSGTELNRPGPRRRPARHIVAVTLRVTCPASPSHPAGRARARHAERDGYYVPRAEPDRVDAPVGDSLVRLGSADLLAPWRRRPRVALRAPPPTSRLRGPAPAASSPVLRVASGTDAATPASSGIASAPTSSNPESAGGRPVSGTRRECPGRLARSRDRAGPGPGWPPPSPSPAGRGGPTTGPRVGPTLPSRRPPGPRPAPPRAGRAESSRGRLIRPGSAAGGPCTRQRPRRAWGQVPPRAGWPRPSSRPRHTVRPRARRSACARRAAAAAGPARRPSRCTSTTGTSPARWAFLGPASGCGP